MLDRLTPPQRDLTERLIALATETFGEDPLVEGWFTELEFWVWDAVTDAEFVNTYLGGAYLHLPRDRAAALAELSKAAGGWIAFDTQGEIATVRFPFYTYLYNKPFTPVFMSTEAWHQRFAAWRLKACMSGLSQQMYSGGWCGGIEYELWSMLLAGSDPRGYVSEQQLNELRTRSDTAGGWLYEDGNGVTFIGLAEWKQRVSSMHRD